MMKIKFLVMDVDGTLTDGKIYMGNEGEIVKAFDIKDGCGIHDILIPSGILPVILTGRESGILIKRCGELGILMLYQGVHDKKTKLEEVLQEAGLADSTEYNCGNVAYIGDDINDLAVMQRVKSAGGLVGCPADAAKKIREIADFISNKNGGSGAVRDFIEWLVEIE